VLDLMEDLKFVDQAFMEQHYKKFEQLVWANHLSLVVDIRLADL
jgi:hypothetical protein